MSDRLDFFFRQRVTEADMDAAFDKAEAADINLTLDISFGQQADPITHVPYVVARTPDSNSNDYGLLMGGIHQGLKCQLAGAFPVVTPHTLQIPVTAGFGHDPIGRRIMLPTDVVVDCQSEGDTPVGQAGSTTGGAIVTPSAGNTRVITLMILFDRVLLDPHVDGNAATVYYQRNESFKFRCKMGALVPYVSGAPVAPHLTGAPVPPPPDAYAIILGDFTVNAANQIVWQDFSRRGDWIRGHIDGTTVPVQETDPVSSGGIIEGNPRRALARISHITGGAAFDFAGHTNTTTPTFLHHSKNITTSATTATFATGATLGGGLGSGTGGVGGVWGQINELVNRLGNNVGGNSGGRLVQNDLHTTLTYAYATGNVGTQLFEIIDFLHNHVARGSAGAVSPFTDPYAHRSESIQQVNTFSTGDGLSALGGGSLNSAIVGLGSRMALRGIASATASTLNTWGTSQLWNAIGALDDAQHKFANPNVTNVGDRQLIFEMDVGYRNTKVRFYIEASIEALANGGCLAITTNALWVPSGGYWISDRNSWPSRKLEISAFSVMGYAKDATAASWTGSGWTTTTSLF